MKYYSTLPEECETTINISYFDRTLSIYTNKKSIIQRLSLKLGEPDKKDYINKSLASARWDIRFSDKKRMSIALSKPLLIGQMKSL